MRKLFCLILFLPNMIQLSAQPGGQWGVCEFETLADLSSFDPSGSNWDCKIAFVQSINQHYYWAGNNWQLFNTQWSDTTISGVDGIIAQNAASGEDIVFVSDEGELGLGILPSDAKISIGGDTDPLIKIVSNTENIGSYIGTLQFLEQNGNWGMGIRHFDGTGQRLVLGSYNNTQWNELLSVNHDLSGGNIRLDKYGLGNITGNQTYILGVEADGDIVEVDAGDLAGDNSPTTVELGWDKPEKILTVTVNGVSDDIFLNGASDIRLKNKIHPLELSLSRILRLNGYSFQYRTNEFPQYEFDDSVNYGVMAQELEEVFPELVSENRYGHKIVDYDGLIPVLIEAIKEQQAQINKLQQELKLIQKGKN